MQSGHRIRAYVKRRQMSSTFAGKPRRSRRLTWKAHSRADCKNSIHDHTRRGHVVETNRSNCMHVPDRSVRNSRPPSFAWPLLNKHGPPTVRHVISFSVSRTDEITRPHTTDHSKSSYAGLQSQKHPSTYVYMHRGISLARKPSRRQRSAPTSISNHALD
jgi:hypothetical protein